jgi:translation elongation factor EF-1alpha
MGFSGGCLWEQLLGSIRKTLRVKLNHCSEEPGLLAIDRVVNVRGLGDVIEGKVIRGSFNVSQKVKLVPNLEPSGHINNKVPIGKISSIKQIMGEQLNEALEGDMIGIRISGFGITKLPRGAVLIAEDTPFVQGRNLSLLVQAEAAKEMALGSHYGVNWFGKVIWCQLTKLEGNKASLVIEGGQGTSALFVSPLDKGNLQFDSLTFFNSGSSTMISATLISID